MQRKYLCGLVCLAMFAGILTGCSDKTKKRAGENLELVTDSAVIAERISHIADSDTKGMIQEFYETFVLDTEELNDDMARKFCTEKMVRILHEEYDKEYADGGGMAVWKFRSGRQDGPSSESRVVEIIATGDKQYEVNYLDMGLRCTSRITTAIDNGIVKIDHVQLINIQE